MALVSSFNFRVSRIVLVGLLVVNVFFVVALVEYYWNFTNIDYRSTASWKALQDYLSEPEVESSGYILEPGNVQFKFTNPKGKEGTPKEILEQNEQVYREMFKDKIGEPKDADIELFRPPPEDKIDQYDRANATIIALVRNREALKIGLSIRMLEKRFNKKFKYPYTFINDEPFDEKFKQKISRYTDAEVNFVTIPPGFWDKPGNIDTAKERKLMDQLSKENIAYAKMGSYHNMCRFYLGNIFNLPELRKYRYYWRVEPKVDFFSNINYDVFKYLEKTEKVYGFTISLYDIEQTIKSLWSETLKFLNKGDNYKYVNPNGAFQWLLENQQNPKKFDKTGYSTCHFWTNFEIVDMDFFRSEAYTEYFKHLDEAGGFYYERWGDAPVRSIALGLFTDKSKVHWFRDIGYYHDPYLNCPNSDNTEKCTPGKFSIWKHLADQNCIPSWIDYALDDPSAIY